MHILNGMDMDMNMDMDMDMHMHMDMRMDMCMDMSNFPFYHATSNFCVLILVKSAPKRESETANAKPKPNQYARTGSKSSRI